MAKSGSVSPYVCALILGLAMSTSRPAAAADFYVTTAAGLQTALNSAQGGDTVLLAPGTYVGNFKLPIHGGTGYVTVRTADSLGLLPAPGTRITPAASANLAKLVSSNSLAVLRTAPSAAYWRLEQLEIGPGPVASTTLIELGDGSSVQNSASQVPHHLIVDRLYVHGDKLAGQKRAFGLNSGETSILNSYVGDIKAIAVDSQAVAGWNGPGPYQIENNYFEAAGTSVLFGGDDPKVPYQLPSDITFRDNTVTRPLAWRNAILATPDGVRASFVSGGGLAAGTYGYRVVARRMISTTQVKSAAAAEVVVTVAQGSTATIQWNAVQDAADYLVYGRTAGAANRYWVVKGTSFNDDGVIASTAGTPSAATVWQTKNLFELKAARHVQVAHNLFENNWAQAQSGTAILFTTRNQGGNCGWCVVEDVTFENNVVRGIGGGFQVTGWDNLYPSLQGNAIRVRNNLIADLSKSWGGKAYLATITDSARDVTFDHNTVISPDGTGIILADGGAITGFVLTNNVARHNAYGIFGSGYAVGNKSIVFYFPGSVITRNALAGGSASLYPVGNLFPTVANFESHFVDYVGGNYTLVPGTDWQASGTDGMDLGADLTQLVGAGSATAGSGAVPMPAEAPPPAPAPAPAPVIPPLQFNPLALPDTTEGDAYSSSALVASGGVAPYNWTISAGALPPGIYLDSTFGALVGGASLAGDFAFTVRVSDAAGTAATQPLSIHVNRAIPPVMILTSALNTITSTLPSAQALNATGGLGTYSWSITGGLPAGITFSPSGVLSGTTTAQATGTYAVMITATDAQDSRRSASQAYSLYVAPPPNHPPTVSLSASTSGSVVAVGSTITLTANAADVDGNLARVDFYVGTTLIGTSAGPTVNWPWLVATAGTHQFSAIATDTRGETAVSQTVTIGTRSEIVLYASDAKRLVGNYQLALDATAAGGAALWNPDLAAAKLSTASAAPASYAEFTFYAEAGRPYHLWIRGRAQKNAWANDSAYVQFSGVAAARIGTTSGLWYNLEVDVNAGVSGWGWEDNGYGIGPQGTGVQGANVVFETTGLQTLRIQPREDGLYVDQIVLSPQQFLTTAPGVNKNDTTILSR